MKRKKKNKTNDKQTINKRKPMRSRKALMMERKKRKWYLSKIQKRKHPNVSCTGESTILLPVHTENNSSELALMKDKIQNLQIHPVTY